MEIFTVIIIDQGSDFLLFLLIAFITFILCITLNKVFKVFKLYKKNYIGKLVPYSGGTIVYLSLFIAFIIFYTFGEISFIKVIFFLSIITLVYMIGFLDDLLGTGDVKGIKGNINALVSKKVSTGIVKAISIIIIACYIYFFFNEEYWILKGIITALTTNLFNQLDLRPGRCIKSYYPFFIIFSFSNIRWTEELFIMISIIITLYYLWDAYSFSMLGDSGSNLIGFIIGLILSEVIGTNLLYLITFLSILIITQFFMDKYSLTVIIKNNSLLDYIDRFLTERQALENVKSRKRKSY